AHDSLARRSGSAGRARDRDRPRTRHRRRSSGGDQVEGGRQACAIQRAGTDREGSRRPTGHGGHHRQPQRPAADEPARIGPARAFPARRGDFRSGGGGCGPRGRIHRHHQPLSAVTAARAPIGAMLFRQTSAEFLKLWRVPAFSATSLLLPVVFYAFIGIGQASQRLQGTHVTFGAYFLASMAVYAVANVMIFSFGISVANERRMEMHLLMRATPLPPLFYLLSKCITAIVFAALTLAVLFPFAYIAGGVTLDGSEWFTLAYRVLLGSIPFIALGFAIGYLAGPNSAIAVINLIYLPTAFASGLFFPKQL